MDLINRCMNELSYTRENDFSFGLSSENISLTVHPFVSKDSDADVCLFLPLDVQTLRYAINDVFLSELFHRFCAQDFYQSDFDKNTSLVYVVEIEDGYAIPDKQQIDIEDDPYYFKKYLMTYSAAEKLKALEYINSVISKSGNSESLIKLIQRYIGNVDYFEQYKNNFSSVPVYSFFITLATKIPCFPFDVFDKRNLADFDILMSSDGMSNYDLGQVEKFIDNPDLKDLNPEQMIRFWNDCNKHS